MAQVKVIFKKGGSAYGYGYLAGDKGTISSEHFEKLESLGVVVKDETKAPAQTKAEKEAKAAQEAAAAAKAAEEDAAAKEAAAAAKAAEAGE